MMRDILEMSADSIGRKRGLLCLRVCVPPSLVDVLGVIDAL